MIGIGGLNVPNQTLLKYFFLKKKTKTLKNIMQIIKKPRGCLHVYFTIRKKDETYLQIQMTFQEMQILFSIYYNLTKDMLNVPT